MIRKGQIDQKGTSPFEQFAAEHRGICDSLPSESLCNIRLFSQEESAAKPIANKVMHHFTVALFQRRYRGVLC